MRRDSTASSSYHSRSMTPTQMLVGVDIGGTKTQALVLDPSFKVHGQATSRTNTTNPTSLVSSVLDTVQRALKEAGVTSRQLIKIGVGVPGQVLPKQGEVRLAVNLNLKAYPLGQVLSAKLGVPCLLENDVRVAALGAYHWHRGSASGKKAQRIKNMAYVNIGTGVSAGLILNGQLYRGSHGMAGEIGHAIMDSRGPRCKCGMPGCLEAFIGGPAIASQGEDAIQAGANTLLKKYQPLSARRVYEIAQEGDQVAQVIVQRAGGYLGLALQQLVMFYDVEHIILGGGVTQAGTIFLDAILQEWARLRSLAPLACEMLNPDMLSLADPSRNMVAFGAVVLASRGLVINLGPRKTRNAKRKT